MSWGPLIANPGNFPDPDPDRPLGEEEEKKVAALREQIRQSQEVLKIMMRQGDVLLRGWPYPLPKGLSLCPSNAFAEDTATGHAHELLDGRVWTDAKGTCYLEVPQATQVVHPDHRPLTLAPGSYLVLRRREYTPAPIREVGSCCRTPPLSPDDRIQPGQQELTPTQLAGAQQFAQAWSALLLSAAPVEEAEAEAHLRQAYQVAGLEPPHHIRWFDSPLAFGRACLVPEGEQPIWSGLRDGQRAGDWNTRWNGVREHVWSTVRSRVLAGVEERLWTRRDSLAYSVQPMVDVSLRRQLEPYLSEQLWNQIQEYGWDGDEARARLLTRVSHVIWQSLWAYHLAGEWASLCFLQDWFADHDLAPLARLHLLISGSWLGRQEAWLVRKPTRLECDEQGRLHSVTGPAVLYPDGWGISAWHGVRVPLQFILAPETLTKERWLAEPNAQARRVVQELLVPERLIGLMGGICIDQGTYGDLFEVPLGDDPERVAHYVHLKEASTERASYLRVPPGICRADEAVAWTFGVLDAATYQPSQET